MKKGEARKQVKLAVHVNPLRVLMEQSHTARAHYQVKAILQPLQQKESVKSPTQGVPRQDTLSSAMSQRAEGRQHSDLNPGCQRKGTTKSNNKASSESTNELTETLATMKSPDHIKQLILRLNLLRRYKVSREESEVEDIDRIIYNDKAHVVAMFKDYLIYDDIKELLQETHKSVKSVCLLRKLVAARTEKMVPCDVLLNEYSVIKKGKEKKEKIRRLKEDERNKGEEGSTFFRTAFMNSLAKEDLSNSLSKLPANSLECEDEEDSHKILELLKELNSKDVTLMVRKTKCEDGKPEKRQEKPKQSVHAAKKTGVEKNQTKCAPKMTAKILSVKQNKSRPMTTMQLQPKAVSPSPYFVAQRTVKVAPASVSKIDSTLKQDSSIGAASIDNLSKDVMRKLRLTSKGPKDSAPVTLKTAKRPHNVEEQLKSMEVAARCVSKHTKPSDNDPKKTNHFALYDTHSHLPSSREVYNVVKSPISARHNNAAPFKEVRSERGNAAATKGVKGKVGKNALQESIESLLSRSAQVARIVKLGSGLKNVLPAKDSRKLVIKPQLLRSTPELRLVSKQQRYVQKCFSPGNLGKGGKLG